MAGARDALAAPMAGLPESRAIVCVGPPLFFGPAGSSLGSETVNGVPVSVAPFADEGRGLENIWSSAVHGGRVGACAVDVVRKQIIRRVSKDAVGGSDGGCQGAAGELIAEGEGKNGAAGVAGVGVGSSGYGVTCQGAVGQGNRAVQVEDAAAESAAAVRRSIAASAALSRIAVERGVHECHAAEHVEDGPAQAGTAAAAAAAGVAAEEAAAPPPAPPPPPKPPPPPP